MKFNIKTKEFISLIFSLQSVIKEGHVVPILQNVKLDFSSGKIVATGENLEINCSNTLKLDLVIKDSFSTCVPFHMLLATLKTITDSTVSLSVTDKQILINHKKGSFKIPTESSDEFPVIEKEQFSKKAKISSSAFKSSIKVANRFILNDDMTSMSNISMSIGKSIYIRSTDRNRLFEEKIKGKGDKEDILISGKASVALSTLMEDSEELEIKYNSEKIYFKFGTSEVIVIQQQGDFPLTTFKKVLDCANDAELLKLNLKEFLTSLRRVSVLSTKDKSPVVRMDIKKKKAIVSCESIEISTRAEETISLEFPSEKIIGYNYKYLIEILSIFDKEPELYIDERNCLFIKQKKKTGALSPMLLNK